MKATPSAALLSLFLAVILGGLCAFSPAPASAQDRAAVFTVAGIRVDETADNGAAAQSQGFTAATRAGFERLVRRYTLPADLQRLGVVRLEDPVLERMSLSVDVEEERRSATRYIARLTVRFDANQVRAALRNAGYTMVETRAPPVLIVPVVSPGSAPEVAPVWRDAWTQAGLGQELAPLVVAPPIDNPNPDWAAVAPFASDAAAATALYASLSVQSSTASASLVEVAANGVRRERGGVSARVSGLDSAALRTALDNLVQQVNSVIQDEWKGRAAVALGPRARVSATALYSNQRDWERIKAGLEAAAASTISEIRIEAVAREGALVSFSFVGDRAALGEELNRRGVSLEEDRMGPVLRVVRR